MKKVMSICLAVLLVFQVGIVTFAQEDLATNDGPETAALTENDALSLEAALETAQDTNRLEDLEPTEEENTEETAEATALDISGEGSQIISYGYSGTDYTANVYLPDGYGDTQRRYPTVYLMPQDGLSSEQYIEEGIQDHLDALMLDGDDVMDMIVVMPDFSEGDDFRLITQKLVAEVDRDFRTVAATSQRGVMGVGTGGYMAFILGYTDTTGATISTPGLFGAIGSHMGHFTDNMWLATYGNVYDKINSLSATVLGRFYTYIDGAVNDPHSSIEKSTNAIGALFRSKSNFTYDVAEFTVRPGDPTVDFYQESMERSFNRFSNRFINGVIASSSGYSVSPQKIEAGIDEFTVTYGITLSDTIESFIGTDSEESYTLEVKVTMTDPESGELLYDDVEYFDDIAAGNYDGTFILPASETAPGLNTTVEVFVRVLGMDITLGTEPLVRVEATGSEPEYQLIDLMGDWYFRVYRTLLASNTLDNIANLTPDVYTQTGDDVPSASRWYVVQPGLDWWTVGFGNVTSTYQTGFAWYVREFEIPEEFVTTEGLILAAGKIDDCDVIYINGQVVGMTGMREDGSGRVSHWEDDRVYYIDSDVLNYEGTNTIAVKMANINGGGGWYEGPIGIYSPSAFNRISGKPYVPADEDDAQMLKDFVAAQNALIESSDLAAYAETVHSEYFESGDFKEDKVAEIAAILSEGLTVTDSNINVFTEEDLLLYQANRLIVDANGTVVLEDLVEEYYSNNNGEIYLYGKHDRFFAKTFYSNARRANIEYRVYLPESYFESDTRYPSMYLLHQLNSSSNAYEIDGIHNIMDEGMAAGDIREMILVIPDSSASSWWTGTWETMVVDDLMSLIDGRYRTIQDGRYRGTMGCSMGGYGSFAIGFNNPEKFTAMISFYGALGSSNGGQNPQTTAANQPVDYLSRYTYYFICGNRDSYGFGSNAVAVNRSLTNKGIAHRFFIENGEHDSSFYVPYAYEAFQYVSDRMLTVEANDSVANGSVTVEDGIIRYSASLTGGIDPYLDYVPASSYTSNQTPDLLVPVTVKVTQNGNKVYEQWTTVATRTATTLEDTIDVADLDLDIYKDYTVSVIVSVLDANIVVASADVAGKIVPVESIDLNAGSLNMLSIGKTLELNPTITPANASDKTVTYTSNNPNVASVDENGVVTAHKTGTALITATASNGKVSKTTVRVTY